MGYSNGYDLSAVNTALTGRIGFRQPAGSGAPVLDTPAKASASGRYFQDFHAIVTVNNIKAVMEQPGASDSDLNTYLANLKQAAVARALNGVFPEKRVIDQIRLFSQEGINDKPIENSGKFVGIEIEVAETSDVAVQLDAVHLYFDSDATFDLYLFKDGKQSEEWHQSVTAVANDITEIALTDKVIGKGRWYLGYFQEDLGSAKAYWEVIDDCNKASMFEAEFIQATKLTGTLFDRDRRAETNVNFGLNLEISSFMDHTLQIKRKAAMFDELIGLTMAAMVLEQVIYSTASNGVERILKDQLSKVGIQMDLNGAAPVSDSPQIVGLKQRIDRETETVRALFYPKRKSQTVNLCDAD